MTAPTAEHDHTGPGCAACATHWYRLGLAHGRLQADADEARAIGMTGELVSFLIERATAFATTGTDWAATTHTVPKILGGDQ